MLEHIWDFVKVKAFINVPIKTIYLLFQLILNSDVLCCIY